MQTLPEPDLDYMQKVLLEMLAIPSPTGFTDTIVRYVAERLEELEIPFELTRRGTIRATLRGRQSEYERFDRAVSVHLDTIGAIVREIKDNGRLGLAPVGCWSSRFAEGSRVSLFTDNGVIRGSVLPLLASGHAFNTAVDSMPVSWDHVELRLDAYCATRADCDTLGIAVGDFVAFDPLPEFSESGHISARHLDDKAGAAALLASLKAIRDQGLQPMIDCHPLFTITEEVGSGAAAALPSTSASSSALISPRSHQASSPASTPSAWPCRIPAAPTTITCRASCCAWQLNMRYRFAATCSVTTTATHSQQSPPAMTSAPRCWPSAATPPMATSVPISTASRPSAACSLPT